MDHVTLGRTGLRVSRLCLGTMNFGPKTTEPDSFAIMDRALELEVNFFDTADVYGWKLGEGWTESIVGRWFAQGGGRRDKVVLATKLYGEMGKWPNMSKLSARHIRDAVDGSLRRLQTDFIDLYQMHHIDRETPWEEIWEAFGTLRSQGKVLYFGTSNFPGWALAQGNERAYGLGLVSEQSLYNLTARMIELEVIPAVEEYGMALLPWSPLGGGVLGGVLKAQAEAGGRRADERTLATIDRLRPQLERWEKLCDELELAPADAALAWLLHQPAVTAPIVGPRTGAQLEAAVRAETIHLDDASLARMGEIFPGFKPAPEQYAW